jgi:acetyl esterase
MKKLFKILLIPAILFLGIVVWNYFSVTPGVWFYTTLFDYGGKQMNENIADKVPDNLLSLENLVYDPQDADALLDVYLPKALSGEKLPTIVWIHGGGYISGDKSQISNFAKILAAEGFAVITPNYSLAPRAHYPTPIVQMIRLMNYLYQGDHDLPVDLNRIMLAGDSAGSHIAAQVALVMHDPTYAEKIQVVVPFENKRLQGVILFCGPYDIGIKGPKNKHGHFMRTVLWAYAGTKDFENDPAFQTASVVQDINALFPPAFVSVGNADPLKVHSQALVEQLVKHNVPHQTLFFPDTHRPELRHEYQFDLQTQEGQQAFEAMVGFIKDYM